MLAGARSRVFAGRECPRCRAYAAAASQSSLSPAPSLLLKLRTDLKTAMKDKDTNRLNVLRSLLAEVTNAAKTNSPIKTDMQLLSLLRRRSAAAKAAQEEFRQAGRSDLVEREEGQSKVLEEYAGSVETLSDDDIHKAVDEAIRDTKAHQGGNANMVEILKKLLSTGGTLDGQAVDRADVARIVKQALATPS